MPKHGPSSELFPPLNYSRSYFTQWLLQSTNPEKKSHGKKTNKMELIQLLAINALEFTAPVYSFLNKEGQSSGGPQEEAQSSSRGNLSDLKLDREIIQLSGHPGSFAPAGPNSIWKKMPEGCLGTKAGYSVVEQRLRRCSTLSNQNESKIYELLRSSKTEQCLVNWLPGYINRAEYKGSTFIELEDLVTRFNVDSLSIMDIKLGTRTFLEAEVNNSKPREDLFLKMIKIDPNAATEEERAQRAVSKLRYMIFREHQSSTTSLGFRIEGVKSGSVSLTTNFATLKNEQKIRSLLQEFSGNFKSGFLSKLCELRSTLEKSAFFMRHEMIGSSLLLIHDEVNYGVWVIDLAKTFECEANLNHRSQWQLGNREDGVLIGVDNLIRILQL